MPLAQVLPSPLQEQPSAAAAGLCHPAQVLCKLGSDDAVSKCSGLL